MVFKKKWLLIIGAILLLLIILHFVKQNLPNPINIKSNLPGSDITEELLSQLPSCGNEIRIYNSSPILPSDYSSITPLGNVYPISGHVAPADHLYLHIKTIDPNDKKSLAVEVPIYSPGNVQLLRIDKIEVKKPIPYSDYSLFFSPCKEFVSEYHHVSSLSNKILEQLKEPAYCDKRPEQNYCIYYINITLSAGEIIGSAGGAREKARDLDLEAYDFRVKEADFVNKERYTKSQLHKVCPFDYFTEEIKAELYNKTQNKNCGEFMQDIPGTLQGNWVQKVQDNLNNEDYVLALMHLNSDIKRPLFSFGKKTIPNSEANWLTFDLQESGNINRDFSETTDGEVYCYQNLKILDGQTPVDYSFLIQTNTDNSMKLKVINSRECVTFDISSDVIEFER